MLATGKATAQVTGRHQGRILFVSLGSTAIPREGGLDGQYEVIPKVSGSEGAPPISFGPGHFEGGVGFNAYVEYRVAEVDTTAPDPPPLALWARLAGGRPSTRAGSAFADMIPPAIAHAAGFMGGGPSLDNSLRFGRLPSDTTWVLLELRGHLSYGSHAHGSVRVWSPEGDLLAVAARVRT